MPAVVGLVMVFDTLRSLRIGNTAPRSPHLAQVLSGYLVVASVMNRQYQLNPELKPITELIGLLLDPGFGRIGRGR